MRAIITYHSIDDSGSPVSVSPDEFSGHLRWFDSGQVPIVTVTELVNDPLGPPAIALTFDDALQTAADSALPRLAERGIPATVFVPTGHVGRDNRWAGSSAQGVPDLPVMTWRTLATVNEQGMEVGGHSRSHPNLSKCGAEELEDEVVGCAEDIQRELGVVPTGFAYPYGSTNAAVREATQQHFRYSVTTDLRPVGPAEDRFALPRLDAWYLRESRWLERWGSASMRAFLGIRRTARAVKGVLR